MSAHDTDPSSPERKALAELDRHLDESRRAKGKNSNNGAGADGPTGSMAGAMRLGVEFVACIGVGAFLGISLDRWANTAPWGAIILIALGVMAGFVSAWRMFRHWENEAARQDTPHQDTPKKNP
ncbi:MAG: AtpZ/AtpI family protein [Alphaproteobacteria bacterium]|nr:MAG: AtpZ/AtpI family protein [Alphaproteobacteria bacterium]